MIDTMIFSLRMPGFENKPSSCCRTALWFMPELQHKYKIRKLYRANKNNND